MDKFPFFVGPGSAQGVFGQAHPLYRYSALHALTEERESAQHQQLHSYLSFAARSLSFQSMVVSCVRGSYSNGSSQMTWKHKRGCFYIYDEERLTTELSCSRMVFPSLGMCLQQPNTSNCCLYYIPVITFPLLDLSPSLDETANSKRTYQPQMWLDKHASLKSSWCLIWFWYISSLKTLPGIQGSTLYFSLLCKWFYKVSLGT